MAKNKEDNERDFDEKQVEAFKEFKRNERKSDEDLKKRKIKKASEHKQIQLNLGTVQTGIFKLDPSIGYHGNDGLVGIAAREIVEFCGPSACGKSSAAVEVAKTTLERFGPHSVVWLNSESLISTLNMFELKGIDIDDILFKNVYDPDIEIRKNLAEDQLEWVLAMSEDPTIRLIVIDSVAALATGSQLYDGKGANDNRDLEVSPVAALAKVFNNFILQFSRRNKNAVLLMINHWKPPITTGFKLHEGTDTPGGQMKQFLSNLRLLFTAQTEKDIEAHSVSGTKQSSTLNTRIEIFKNKYCNPTNNRVCKIAYDFINQRFDNEESALEWATFFGERVNDPEDKAKKRKITVSELEPKIAQAGAWWYIGDQSFNGTDQAVKYLIDNPEIYAKIKEQFASKERLDRFFMDTKPDFSQQMDG